MRGVVFKHPDKKQEWVIPVVDEWPDLPADLDMEGRWYIKVSLPLFINLVAEQGYYPVEKEVNDGED